MSKSMKVIQPIIDNGTMTRGFSESISTPNEKIKQATKSTEKKKRIPKPPMTAAVRRLVEILPRILAGEIAYPDHEKRLHDWDEPFDPEKLKETHQLVFDILKDQAAGKTISDSVREKADKALSIMIIRNSTQGRGGLEIELKTQTKKNKPDKQDWDSYYRAQLIYEIQKAYEDEDQPGGVFPLLVDYYVGVCKKCEKPFIRKQANSEYCSRTCINAVNVKNWRKKCNTT